MTLYRYVVKDLVTSFRKIAVTSAITEMQVLFWVQTVANRFRSQHLEKGYDTGAYLNIFSSVPVSKDKTSTNPNQVKGRKYIELPTNIYDFKNERGIDYIAYELNTGLEGFRIVPFQQTSPRKAHRLEYSEYEKPTPANPYFYRIHERVYLLGVENVNVRTVEVGLYSTLIGKTNLVSLDDTLDLTDESIAQLRYEVLNLGRFALMVPQDRTNDGTDTSALKGKQAPLQEPPQEQQ